MCVCVCVCVCVYVCVCERERDRERERKVRQGDMGLAVSIGSSCTENMSCLVPLFTALVLSN